MVNVTLREFVLAYVVCPPVLIAWHRRTGRSRVQVEVGDCSVVRKMAGGMKRSTVQVTKIPNATIVF